MKRIKCIACTVGLVFLAGCEVTRGGSGETTSGSPVIGELRMSADLEQSIYVASLEGWECTGVLTDQQGKDTVSSTIQVPLVCSAGLTGRSFVSVDRVNRTGTIVFRLTNGVSGTVRFG